MPESLADEIKAIPGVTQIDTARVMTVLAAGHKCVLTARNFGLYQKLPLDMMSGEPKQVLERLVAGEVVVGAVLAQRAKLGEGSHRSKSPSARTNRRSASPASATSIRWAD